jgi:GGDEF domain-containing protein
MPLPTWCWAPCKFLRTARHKASLSANKRWRWIVIWLTSGRFARCRHLAPSMTRPRLRFSREIAGPVAAMTLVQLAICAYITLVANYTMERDLMRAYLFSLRDRLRHSLADAASKLDALTGLANRHHLDIELRRLWAADGERPAIVSAIMMDIDHFKRLNDRYGHGAGDLCLKRWLRS